MIGIYKIENTINHKVYIGQSVDIEMRWKEHLYALTRNVHENNHLQNSWNKYGAKAFTFSIIEECELSCLTDREQYYIDLYGGINSDNNYNNRDASYKGNLSESTKQKLRDINLGKPAWNKGLDKSDPRVAKYAENLATKTISNEQREKIRRTVQKHHANGDYDYEAMTKKRLATIQKNLENGKVRKVRKDKGIKKDPEIGKRISEAKKRNNESRKNSLGYVHSPETRDKIRNYNLLNSASKNKIWVNNDIVQLRIETSLLDEYLENGYKKGMIKSGKKFSNKI